MLPADSPFASLPAPGPHPATAELRAYAAGTLNPADEHRIESHALDCARCAELLEGFAMSDAATTDQALAGLRTRLQARVGQPQPVANPYAWPRIAAAAALLAAVGTGIWGWERYEVGPAATARVETTAAAAPPAAPPAAAAATAPEAPAAAAVVAPETAVAPTSPRATTASPASATAEKGAYAALRPARPGAARLPTVRPTTAPNLAMQGAANDQAVAAPAVPVAAETQGTAPAIASAAAAPAFSNNSDQPVRVAADTVPAPGEATLASRLMKAKAAPANSAALVANTPMPAAMAIAPAPTAGTPALRSYLQREAAKFEPEEGAKALHGTVRLRFVVEADGKLSNLQVVRSLRDDYDDEALRLVCEGPAWRPGIAGGRRAALPTEITVSF